jgi:hypothetical protein
MLPSYAGARKILSSNMKLTVTFASMAQIVVGCKGDLESDRQVSDSEAADWARQNRAQYILTSCKTGENVEEAFSLLVRTWRRWKAEHAPPPNATGSAKLPKPKSNRTICLLQ